MRDDDPSVVAQAAPDDADVLPELIAEVATSMLKGLAGARHPLAAELVLASMFGVLGEGLPPELDDLERSAAISELLSGLIEYCQRRASPDAVGFLRMAALEGPARTRRAADEALRTLAERGAGKNLPWAASVGAPSLLRAWRYGDVFGSQSSIGVLFAYRQREHAVSVLIDHDLGGGIKDAWLAEGRGARGLRDRVAAGMAAEPMAIFDDLTEREALDGLRAALAAPPCPEQTDQIEDVAANLYLVHARARHLARLLGEAEVELFADTLAEAGRGETATAVREVFRLKVTLAWSRPPIWRRLDVPATMTLADLHHTLQTAFGWTDSHLHAFEIDSGGPRPRTLEGPQLNRTRLSSVLVGPGDRLDYVYDFGDNWVHTIAVEERLPAADDEVYPRCTGGRRAGPPEDSGGVPGYERLLEILADPGHPEHEELTDWAGPIDPARFDRTAVNAALKRLLC